MEEETQPTNQTEQSQETRQFKNLTKIEFSQVDRRSEQEKVDGMPAFNNEGLLSIELDKQAIASLLKEEGLTPQQISALEVVFKAARFSEAVDLSGAFIAGIAAGPKIEVFTSNPVLLHKESNPPQFRESPFEIYMSASPQSVVIKTLLHELKHYVQYTKGVNMSNSWAARTNDEHDELPTEREAEGFAKIKSKDFAGKLKLYDEGRHFKPASEVIPKGFEYATGMFNSEMVARFIEDSPESNLAYEYFDRFKTAFKRPILKDNDLLNLLTQGRQLVEKGVIAASEFNAASSMLIERMKEVSNLIGATVVESSMIYGVV